VRDGGRAGWLMKLTFAVDYDSAQLGGDGWVGRNDVPANRQSPERDCAGPCDTCC